MKQEYDVILNKFSEIFPVPVINIANALGYEINYFIPDEDTIKISGFVDYKNKKIGINNLDSEYRQRFTIAHEIGHIINGDDAGNDFYIDYRDNIEGKNKDKKEMQANKFAINLLIPKNEFILKFNEFKNLGRSDMLILMNLSLHFGVPENIIKMQINNLNLIGQLV